MDLTSARKETKGSLEVAVVFSDRKFPEEEEGATATAIAIVAAITTAKENDKKYKPFALSVYIKTAQILPKIDVMGSSDPFVQVTVCSKETEACKERKLVETKKTRTNLNTLNPVWNERLDFEWRGGSPDLFCLKLQAYDHDLLKTDSFIGQATVDLKPYFSKHPERALADDWIEFTDKDTKRVGGIEIKLC